jgi:hypothetical protein
MLDDVTAGLIAGQLDGKEGAFTQTGSATGLGDEMADVRQLVHITCDG